MDVSPEYLSEGDYIKALNAVRESKKGNKGELSTEQSNEFITDLPAEILGSVYIIPENKYILFLVNEIGVFDGTIYTTLQTGISISEKVYGDYYIKDNGDTVVIFWDDQHEVRNFIYNKDTCTEVSSFLNTVEHCPRITKIEVKKNGGIDVEIGSYQFFLRYLDEYNNPTSFFILDNFIPVIGDNGTKFDTIAGHTGLTNQSISLEVSNLDTKYKRIEYGVIKTVDSVTTAYIIDRKNITEVTELSYKGRTGQEKAIDISEIITPQAFFVSAKHGLFYENRLLLTGVKRRKNINYQKFANQIKVKYITSRIDLWETNGYKNPIHIMHHKSWMRDEIYAVGIKLKFKDGTTSAPFHIPGPEKTTYDADIIVNTQDCCDELYMGDRESWVPKNKQRWEVENTAIRTSDNGYTNPIMTKEDCLFTENEIPIKTEGKLAYWESCERYPLIKDDEGEYMYPTETLNGEIVGAKIRYWKMPSNTIEPFFESNILKRDNVQRDVKEWQYTSIFPLGIKLENIHLPEDCIGWELVYVKRDDFNKTILDKGVFIKTYTSKLNEKTYIYPRHCVNSARGLDHFSDGVNFPLTFPGGYNPLTKQFENNGNFEEYNKGMVFYGSSLINKTNIDVAYADIEKQFSGHGSYYNRYNNDKEGRWREVETQAYSLVIQNDLKTRKCVEDFSFLKNDSVVNKGGLLEHSIMNKYRETSVYLQFKEDEDVPLSFEGSMLYSDFSIPQCNEAYKEFIKSHTGNYFDYACNYGMLHYGSLKRENCSAYGNVNNLEYISTGMKGCSSNAHGLYGDSYINMLSIHRTSVFADFGNVFVPKGTNTEVYVIDPLSDVEFNIDTLYSHSLLTSKIVTKPHSTLINCFIESDVNLDLRIDDTLNTFYPYLKNKEFGVACYYDKEYPEDFYLNNTIYKLYCTDNTDNCCEGDDCIKYNYDNFFKINKDFDRLSDVEKSIAINENYITKDLREDIIAVSEVDSFKNFKLNNFITIPQKYGTVTNLFQLGNSLYAHTTDSLYKIFVSKSELQTNQNTIYLGNGSILSSVPLPMYITNEGWAGLQDKKKHFQNYMGYFFQDDKTGSVYHFQENMKEINKFGVNAFWLENKSDKLIFAYDHRYDRLLLTKDFTLSYYPDTESFLSFHSYVPDFYLTDRQNFYSITDRKIYKHNSNGYLRMNKQKVSFIIETAETYKTPKILESVNFKTKSYLENGREFNNTFTKGMFYNKNQNTGIVNLVNNKYNKQLNTLTTNSLDHIRITKEEQYYYINEFFNRAADTHLTDELWQQPILEVKNWWEFDRFRDDHLIIRLIYEDGHKLILSFINTETTETRK